MYFGVSDNPSVEALRDACPAVGCGSCVHFNVNNDRQRSTCKRIDHKALTFYRPWFKSYDCGMFNSVMCRDFEPSDTHPYLKQHWIGADAYVGEIPENQRTALFLNGDTGIAYRVSTREFYDGTFITEDLKLRVYGDFYYKRSKSSPTGYNLVQNTYEEPRLIDFLSMANQT